MYRGRFAPSPTGPLHAGSVVAALASWLDARAHHGRWLIRIEDVDLPRCPPGMAELVLQQLAALGLVSDEAVMHQSQRLPAYAHALGQLDAQASVYACTCSRRRLELHWGSEHIGPRPYPGWCRLHPITPKPALPSPGGGDIQADGVAWRLRVPSQPIAWVDRRLGAQTQAVDLEVGDFVVRRSDGLWAYQLAVVCDDAAQGITHVVRGEDLADNTARQIVLQDALGLSTPAYWHGPLVWAEDGHKLSKQTGAQAIDTADAVQTLNAAARVLSLPEAASGASLGDALAAWVAAWRHRWVLPPLAKA